MENKMEDYLGNPDYLKEKIGKMCIDMSGTIEGEYTVLLRVLRGRSYTLEYHQNGFDGYNDHDRFWWEFPLFFYRDMPSGYYVRQTLDGVFYLVDGYEDFVEEIDKNDLMSELVDDLIERNYKEFNDNWNEFLREFQKWIDEED